MAAPKVLEILLLFTVDTPRWRVDRIAERMGVSTSTAYRCVAELVRSGFLQPISGGAYVLGPAFIEFDLAMRLSDPLLRAALPHMAQLRDALGRESSTALARHYHNRVIFVHLDRSRNVASGPVRGEQISLFSPAAIARAMLFALPDRVLRTLYERHAAEVAAQGLGNDAREFRAHVKALRERGWATADSAVVKGRTAIAAPVVCDGTVRGSMAVVLPTSLDDGERERIGALIVQHANLVAAQLREDDPDAPRLLSRRQTTPGPVASALQ